MDIEDCRKRFGAVDLARHVAPSQEHPQGMPAVSLLTIRGAAHPPLPAEEEQRSRLFGPGSNHILFNAVFSVEPVFKELVVGTCNRGLFQGRLTHVNVVKMIQLLSYARLGRRQLLPNQAVTRGAFYQALALAESLGPYIPDEWKLPQAQARGEIIEAVNFFLSEEGVEAVGLAREDWYDPQVLGVPQQLVDIGNLENIDHALVLLEAMAVALPTNTAWLNGISFIGSALLALGRRCTVTDALRDRVVGALKESTSANQVSISPTTFKRFYGMYCNNLSAENAGALFEHYRGILPDNVIVLRNIILQAAGSGMTTYMVILRALSEFGDFPWARLMALAPVDFAHLEAAIAAVGGNVYFGYNEQMATASAKQFPNLAYASFQLCIRAGGDQPLRDYAGKPKVIPVKPQIDQMVEDYIARRTEAAAAAELPDDLVRAAEEAQQRAVAAHGLLTGAHADD